MACTQRINSSYTIENMARTSPGKRRVLPHSCKARYTLSEQFYLVQFREAYNILFLMQRRCWQIGILSLIKSYIYIYI